MSAPFAVPAGLQVTPFAPGAAREILRANPDFLELIGSDPAAVTTRELPNPLERPCMTIQAGVNRRQTNLTAAIRLMISAWVPKAEVLVDLDPPIRMDPEELAWTIADAAGHILDMKRQMGRGPSFQYHGAAWRGTWDEGPATLVDLSRGPENPIYRAVIQVVMRMGSN